MPGVVSTDQGGIAWTGTGEVQLGGAGGTAWTGTGTLTSELGPGGVFWVGSGFDDEL